MKRPKKKIGVTTDGHGKVLLYTPEIYIDRDYRSHLLLSATKARMLGHWLVGVSMDAQDEINARRALETVVP